MKLAKFLPLISKHKQNILKKWIVDKEVIDVLNLYDIDHKLFITKYAAGVFNYYVEVIADKKNIGDCPVIDEMVFFFKEKNIGADSLFVLCTGFKNALLEFLHEQNIYSFELHKQLLYIYEKNFEGVLKRHTQSIKEVNKNLNVSNHLIDENIIMSTTDLKGKITSVSKAFEAISGYSKDELIGNHHNILRHPDMSSDVFKELWETIESNQIWHGEVKNRKKDGGYYWVEVAVSPEFDENNVKIGYSAIRHDITFQKEVETQQDIIIEQSNSVVMSDMISMIAHQWRQPLQAIAILIQRLPLEKLLENEISNETLDNVVNSIDHQLEYMSKTIEDFRKFFNPNKNKEKISTDELVDKVRDFLAYTFKVEDIKLTISANDNHDIHIHINEVIQAFLNILNNAKEVLLERKIEHKSIKINYYKSQENIIFEITDNAGGIPSIIINKIFEPYFSTKKNKNGTGLGLYMAKTIIEKTCHGMLTVRNTEQGASFKITLPIDS